MHATNVANGIYAPDAPQMRTLKECAAHFEASGSKRHEYLLLALHVLEGQVNGKHEKRPER
jgi:hypothetical protein